MTRVRSAEPCLLDGTKLFVAGYGRADTDGLHCWQFLDGRWQDKSFAAIRELFALAQHPSLHVIYGISGAGEDGKIHAWHTAAYEMTLLDSIDSEGAGPSHVAVDPSGSFVIVTHYESSTLCVFTVTADGSFTGEFHRIHLTGSSIDTERQSAPHPHQAVFNGTQLYVPDLGSDLIREYNLCLGSVASKALDLIRETALPVGSGPRHLATLADGQVAVSGELMSTLIVGRLGTEVDDWTVLPSSHRIDRASPRGLRNYPGDIRSSANGRFLYIANRGYDTITTFEVNGATPRFLSERDAGVPRPQHMFVYGKHLLVASRDSSQVVSMHLVDGVPSASRELFKCSGAAWLLCTPKYPKRTKSRTSYQPNGLKLKRRHTT